MKLATPKQLQCIHSTLHRKGLLQHKREMVSSFTNNRTESSKEMTIEEASDFLKMLFDYQPDQDKRQKMVNSIIAMAREMGVITRQQVVTDNGLEWKSDYSKFDEWLLTKSCVKKKNLNGCTYEELPTLVTQYKAIYTSWLHKFH